MDRRCAPTVAAATAPAKLCQACTNGKNDAPVAALRSGACDRVTTLRIGRPIAVGESGGNREGTNGPFGTDLSGQGQAAPKPGGIRSPLAGNVEHVVHTGSGFGSGTLI